MRPKLNTYLWKGHDQSKNKLSGYIKASSKNIVQSKLTQLGIVKIKRISQQIFTIQNNLKLSPKESYYFFSSLLRLIKSGIALTDCIELISKSSETGSIKLFTYDLGYAIEHGQSLSYALENSDYIINYDYIQLIKIGETSGKLEQVLLSISQLIQKNITLNKKLFSAMIYPGCVIAITIVVLAVLFIFIIPQFKTIYHNSNTALPAFTQALLFISDHFSWLLGLGLSIALILGLTLKPIYNSSYKARKIIQKILLKLPPIKTILPITQQANIAFGLQISLSAGVTLERALEQVSSSARIIKFQDYLSRLTLLVKSGRNLSSAIALNPIFSPTEQYQISMAENTGQLDDCFAQISQQLTDQLDQIIENLNQLIEPFIIIFLGGMIGIIIIAMYLPIFQLGNVF